MSKSPRLSPRQSKWLRGNYAKVCLRIVEARQLASADRNGLSDPYVKVSLPPSKSGSKVTKVFKTHTVNKSLSPVWNEYFVLDIEASRLSEVIFDVYDHDQFTSDDFLGQCSLGGFQGSIDSDRIYDKWLRLRPVTAADKVTITGEVRIVFYYTLHTDLAPPSRELFFYKHQQPLTATLKTGDLILFSPTSRDVAGVYYKLANCFDYTHVALVVHLANRFTKRVEVYLYELVSPSSSGGCMDAFRGTHREGDLCLFRADERIHAAPAQSVAHLPLQQPLASATRRALLEHVVHAHARPSREMVAACTTAPPLPESAKRAYDTYGMSAKMAKMPTIADAITYPVVSALVQSGVIKKSAAGAAGAVGAKQLVTKYTDVYDELVVIRAQPQHHYLHPEHLSAWKAGEQNSSGG
eukprot:CAMPEP_0198332326 /NCGR_PEP_ID=MMETSP1450-20131203/18201_1 /TAXON_ID=753684 ORGANISM="Madagascaria erythrocladiodes, Strain CCMP3234" /NCGR_SAMPLE_ID=MMETSP1450 /ASSEMBLY_ACC=CAM_ASM_001115 /LENGTH=409 /DNA_ID=CAMNT_0044036771 /DNA_START=27 /DNA_END=1252 /DNA_ORIENTATION=+